MKIVSGVIAMLLAVPLAAQWSYPTAKVPRTADGKPDLSGVWAMQRSLPCQPMGCVPPEFGNIAVSLKDGLPYQPWAAALSKARKEPPKTDEPITRCLPIGIVERHTAPTWRKIVQTPGLFLILNEYNKSYQIGRASCRERV